MELHSFLLTIASILNLSFGLFILFKERKHKYNIAFAFFSFFLFVWSFSILLFGIVSSDNSSFWIKFSYVAAIFIGISFLYFAYYFPNDKKVGLRRTLLVSSVTALISVFVLWPDFLVEGTIDYSGGRKAILNLYGYTLFTVYFVSCFFGGLYFLIRKRKKFLLKKIQIYFVFFSVFIAGVFGTLFNLVLPSPFLDNWNYIWLGPFFTIIIVVAIAYAILKYSFFDIKVISTEALVIVLTLISVVDFIGAVSFWETIFRGFVMILVVFFGYRLIESVRLEIDRRKNIQHLAAKLKKANGKLEKLDQQKSEFLSIASHQLRTPLTVVKGYVSMLLQGDYGVLRTKKQKEILEKVYESNERLAKLVSELLNLSRIEKGTIQYEISTGDINEIIQTIVEGFRQASDKKDLELVFKAQKLPQVLIDNYKIKDVIINLIDNAIKYSEYGKILVKAELDEEKKFVIVSVKDNGIGVSKSEIGKIFKMFTRAKNNTDKNGCGIGLFVAKEVIEHHGGKIWVESEGVGKGSKFLFSVKVAK